MRAFIDSFPAEKIKDDYTSLKIKMRNMMVTYIYSEMKKNMFSAVLSIPD